MTVERSNLLAFEGLKVVDSECTTTFPVFEVAIHLPRSGVIGKIVGDGRHLTAIFIGTQHFPRGCVIYSIVYFRTIDRGHFRNGIVFSVYIDGTFRHLVGIEEHRRCG